MSEDHPRNPTTTYAAGKAAADLLLHSYIRSFELDIRIVRPFNNFGPRQNWGSFAGVIPRTIDDVERVVGYCAEHELPILPRGGGTSLAGQTVNTAIVLDFSPHCRALVAVDESARAVAQLFRHLLGLMPEGTAHQMDQAHDTVPLLDDYSRASF